MKVFSHTKWMLLLMVLLVGCRETVVEITEVTLVETVTETAVPSATVTMTPTVTETMDESVIAPENVNRLQVVHQIGDGFFSGVDISPDASKIAVAKSKQVYIYDFETLTLLNTLPASTRYPSNITDVAFFPDNTNIAISYETSVQKVNTIDGTSKTLINEVAWDTIAYISISPSGEQIMVTGAHKWVTACDGYGYSLSLYGLDTLKDLLYSTEVCSPGIPFFYKYLDNDTVAVVGANVYEGVFVSFVSLETGEIKHQYTPGLVYDTNHDGSLVLVETPEHHAILETATGDIVESIDGYIGFINENRYFFYSKSDNQTSIRNNQNEIVCVFDEPFLNWYGGNNYYGRTRNINNGLMYIPTYEIVTNNTITIWNLDTCSIEKKLPISWMSNSNPFQYSPNGKILVTHSRQSVDFWNTDTGDLVEAFFGELSDFSHSHILDFDEYGNVYILNKKQDNKYITKIDMATGDVNGFAGPISKGATLDISPNGEYFYLGNLYKKDGTRVKLPPFMEFLSFDLSGNTAVYKNLTDIVTIDLQTGEELNRFTVSDTYDFTVYISDNLERLIIPHFDEPYEIWSMEGEFLAYREEFSDFNIPLTEELYWSEPSTNPSAQAFNPSATLYIEAQRDALRIWDTSTGELLREMRLPFWVEQMDFSPDGTQLAILSGGVTYFWGVPTE